MTPSAPPSAAAANVPLPNAAPRQDLRPLLAARSVVIAGISQLPRFGGWVYQNLRAAGYAGRIFGVNPRYTTVFDQPCYPRLSDLPERPDLAILALPNERLLPALEEVAALGIPAAVIFASAFSAPAPHAPSLQAQLQQLAQQHGLVLCGPNCMGFMALPQRLFVSGYAVRPDLPAGRVAFVSHSGSLWDAIWQNRRGLGFNYLISAGNEIVTTLADYLQFALTDPETRAVGLFLETVRDPATLVAALEAAAARDVPVVALKVGRSERGAALAQTHSGALAGHDAAYDALFARYGVQRARSLDELLDTLELFTAGLRPPTRCIASIHDSGGERGLLVDTCAAEGVEFAAISPATEQRLAQVLEPGLAPVNPLDAWGTGNDYAAIFRAGLAALDADPATGLNVFAADLYAAGTISAAYVDLALDLQPQLCKPLVFLANLADSADEALCRRLRAAGIPVLLGTENGVRAIRHLLDYAEFQRRRAQAEDHAPATQTVVEPARREAGLRLLAQAAGPLDEYASAALLRLYGLPTAEGRLAYSAAEAMAAADALEWPVALKTAAGALHKTDVKGVHLGLADPAALQPAYADLAERLGTPVLVQRMAPAGVELLLGLSRDPQFGLVLTLGFGGIFAEVLRDIQLLMPPVTRADALAALQRLRGARLLAGVRGQPPVQLDAVLDAVVSLSHMAVELNDALEAVDVNPLIATPHGALAVDALVVPRALVREHGQ